MFEALLTRILGPKRTLMVRTEWTATNFDGGEGPEAPDAYLDRQYITSIECGHDVPLQYQASEYRPMKKYMRCRECKFIDMPTVF